MKIFFPDIHITLTKNLSLSFQELGHQIVIPSREYEVKHFPPQNWVWNNSHDKKSIHKYGFAANSLFVSNEELLELKPEVIFVSAFENQFEVINSIWSEAQKWGAKLVFYSGNDYWERAYPWDIIKNYMPADQLGASLCEKYKKHRKNCKNETCFFNDIYINKNALTLLPYVRFFGTHLFCGLLRSTF